jgi:hypothetical protein|uniref:Uncharacterized protein n=1 Tax=Phaeodactylum tricornutum TaxID=2850 RepID=A0A8J9S0B7_PHATR
MEWPLQNATTGKPVTTPTNQDILLAAAEAASREAPEMVASFVAGMKACQNWRSEYVALMEAFVRIQANVTPTTAVAMCRAGLVEATNAFRFHRDDAQSAPFAEAFTQEWEALETETFRGSQNSTEKVQFALASPHGTDANPIFVSGAEAVAQLKVWSDYGCMEPSAAEHATRVCTMKDISSLVRGKTFVLLGVTSEMGPASTLLKIPGAHVIGVSRSGPKLQTLVDFLHQSGFSDTILQVPKGGADLLKQAPQISQWIVESAPKDRPIIIMPLAYMDGEANVRVTIAMDGIVNYIRERRSDVSLTYLTSPTTVYAIPREAANDSKRRHDEGNIYMRAINLMSLGRLAKPSNVWLGETGSLLIYNGLLHLQGPNYALAKIMQQWRCMVAYEEGIIVAAPHAPGTRTYSVVHSLQAAAALEGFQYMEPMIAFDVLPCSTLMTAIILDQVNECSPAKLKHPMELFMDGSVHGGLWRCPFSSDSIGPLAYVLGQMIARKGWCPSGALASQPLASQEST